MQVLGTWINVKLPFAVDQLTWTFLDMKNTGGRIALMWGNTLATTRRALARRPRGPC